MGAQCTRVITDDLDDKGHCQSLTETPVYLHLYDLGTSCAGQAINQLLRPLGSPALHCGVEVFRHEWSYCFLTKDGQPYQGSGVFSSQPTKCDGHSYSQSLRLGFTVYTQPMFADLMQQIEQDWPSYEYDVLGKNCCHFSHDLCSRLGVGGLPDWVMRLSDMGTAIAERQCISGPNLCCDSAVPDGKSSPLCCTPSHKNSFHRDRRRHGIIDDPWKDDLVPIVPVKSAQHGVEETTWYDGECYADLPPRNPPQRLMPWQSGRPASPRRSRKVEEDSELSSPHAFVGGFNI